MATLACEIEVGRQLMMHCAELAADGVTPPEYGAISKVFSGELMERFGEAALDILGMRAAVSEQMPGAIDNGRFRAEPAAFADVGRSASGPTRYSAA